MDIWLVVVMPAGTPREIVATVNADIMQVLRQSDVKEKLAAQGIEAATRAPEEFGELIRADLGRWGRVVKEAGIKGE